MAMPRVRHPIPRRICEPALGRPYALFHICSDLGTGWNHVHLPSIFLSMVGVGGLEPPTSWSQTTPPQKAAFARLLSWESLALVERVRQDNGQ